MSANNVVHAVLCRKVEEIGIGGLKISAAGSLGFPVKPLLGSPNAIAIDAIVRGRVTEMRGKHSEVFSIRPDQKRRGIMIVGVENRIALFQCKSFAQSGLKIEKNG